MSSELDIVCDVGNPLSVTGYRNVLFASCVIRHGATDQEQVLEHHTFSNGYISSRWFFCAALGLTRLERGTTITSFPRVQTQMHL